MGKVNYIKLYERHYGITWNRQKYQIHHIDCNRENNEIENLILLPKELHQRIHTTSCYNGYPSPNMTFNECVKRYQDAVFYGFSDSLFDLQIPPFIDLMMECREWGLYRYLGYNECDGSKMNLD